jgi:hypothetical protein
MIENTVDERIDVAPAAAYAFLTNTGRWHEWMDSVKEARLSGDFAKGAEIVVDYTEGMQVTMRIEQAAPPDSYEYRAAMNDMTIVGRLSLSEDGSGTALTYHETVMPHSLMMKMMQPFISNSMKRALNKDFAMAKEIMEAEK